MTSLRVATFLASAAAASASFAVHAPLPTRASRVSPPADVAMMAQKAWTHRATLAESGAGAGGSAFEGAAGTVEVVFSQGGQNLTTAALPGQPLAAVAMAAGQVVRYQCRKGECGTCEVHANGQAVRTCQTVVPALAAGEAYVVEVPLLKSKTKKASRFFSIKSFFAGFKNNLLGMVGFVRAGRKEKEAFNDRMSEEQRIKELVAAKKAAKAAGGSSLDRKLASALPLKLEVPPGMRRSTSSAECDAGVDECVVPL